MQAIALIMAIMRAKTSTMRTTAKPDKGIKKQQSNEVAKQKSRLTFHKIKRKNRMKETNGRHFKQRKSQKTNKKCKRVKRARLWMEPILNKNMEQNK